MQDYITREDGRYMTDQIKARPITRELTLAEYKELSPEDKKKNVLYIITDATPEGGDITIDTALDSTSDNAVMNKAITLAIDAAVEDIGKNRSSIAALDVSVKALEEKVDGIDGLTVDTDLDATSENPVQNKAITLKVTDLQDAFSGAIGDLSELKTSAKTTVVEAINELYENGGGECSGECVDYSLDGALNDGTLELSLSNGSSIQKLEVGGFAQKDDTGWQSLDLPSGSNGAIRCRRINGIVYVHVSINKVNLTTAPISLFELPLGYRPSQEIYDVAAGSGFKAVVAYTIPTSGIVTAQTISGTNEGCNFMTSYPAA